jgi:hypothetical protein
MASHLSIDEMQPGAGKIGNSLVFVFGNICIIVRFVLDVEAGRRASENEIRHVPEYDSPEMLVP